MTVASPTKPSLKRVVPLPGSSRSWTISAPWNYAAADDGSRQGKRGAVKLTLTEPEIVPMTPEQHRQAVRALSAMILSWLQQRGVAGQDPGVDPPAPSATTA